MVVGFVVAQPLNVRLGRTLMHVGEALTAVGFAGFVLTLQWAGDGIGIRAMSPSLAVVGLGMGLAMAPFFDIVLAGVEDHESGSASGVLTQASRSHANGQEQIVQPRSQMCPDRLHPYAHPLWGRPVPATSRLS